MIRKETRRRPRCLQTRASSTSRRTRSRVSIRAPRGPKIRTRAFDASPRRAPKILRARRRRVGDSEGGSATTTRYTPSVATPDVAWGVIIMNRTSNHDHCARALVHSLDAKKSLPFTSFIEHNSRHRRCVAARTSFCEHLENTPRVSSDVNSPYSFSRSRRRRRVCRQQITAFLVFCMKKHLQIKSTSLRVCRCRPYIRAVGSTPRACLCARAMRRQVFLTFTHPPTSWTRAAARCVSM